MDSILTCGNYLESIKRKRQEASYFCSLPYNIKDKIKNHDLCEIYDKPVENRNAYKILVAKSPSSLGPKWEDNI
jgi:hypothetical protein